MAIYRGDGPVNIFPLLANFSNIGRARTVWTGQTKQNEIGRATHISGPSLYAPPPVICMQFISQFYILLKGYSIYKIIPLLNICCLIYTVIGGINAVLYTDCLQGRGGNQGLRNH